MTKTYYIALVSADGNEDSYAAGDPTPGRGANEFTTRAEAVATRLKALGGAAGRQKFQIGDRVEVDGEPGRVVGGDHLTGKVTVRWFDDPHDSYATEDYASSLLSPRRVRLVERPVRSRPVRCRDKTLAATIEILPCYGGGTVAVKCIRLGEHANDALAIIRQFGGEWH